MGNEFHFTKRRSWMTTPSGHEVNFEQSGGLYWLRWKRAVDTTVDSEGDFRHTAADSNEALRDLAHEESASTRNAKPVHWHECNIDHFHFPFSIDDLGTGMTRCSPRWSDRELSTCCFGQQDALCVRHLQALQACSSTGVGASREHESTTEAPFERVWTDLKGAVTPDFEGNRYVVTFTCELTRWCNVYFVKNKSDVKYRYEEFLKWVKLQGYKVKKLMSDGGGEYTASENAKVISSFEKISVENGITQNFTAAYTP